MIGGTYESKSLDKYAMSELDRNALMTAYTLWKGDRMPAAKDEDAFEVFTVEQILKDADLSDEEIQKGNFGGGGDGGIDGFYFFINGVLMQDKMSAPEAAFNAELYLIQSTRSSGFVEDKVQKMESFCRQIFDWKDLSSRKNLRQSAKEAIDLFRTHLESILTHPHTFTVKLCYASTSVHKPSANLLARVEDIKEYIRSKVTKSVVEFFPFGSSALLESYRSSPSQTLTLEKVESFQTDDESTVCLTRLDKFLDFLTDDAGHMRTWLLESNVRDYQGRNQVNKQIRATLTNTSIKEDFWWLNNGVTILADACSVSGKKLVLTNPEIVNGLQTSSEIFNSLKHGSEDGRRILVKVIVATDDRVKNAIVKATNSQTPVSSIMLKATEPLQFDIEDRLRLLGLFYDRKKGKYKRQKRPIKNIVSIKAMGQAVIAAYLQRPADARARPDTLLSNEKEAPLIFNDGHGPDFFAACILLDRQCEKFLEDNPDLVPDLRTDVRFYLTMLAMCEVTEKRAPTAKQIADSLPKLLQPIDHALLDGIFHRVIDVYLKFGATDVAAKGKEMQACLVEGVKDKFPSDL